MQPWYQALMQGRVLSWLSAGGLRWRLWAGSTDTGAELAAPHSQDSRRVRISVRCALLFLTAAAAGALFMLQSAVAGSLEQVQAAYADGQFLEAADLAEAAGSSEACALGVSALTAYGRFAAADDAKETIFERAVELAAKAVELDPTNANAHLQLARALGWYAENIGRMRALNEKIADRTLEHLETALSIDANSALIHHSMARWHVELIDRMGAFSANLLFGANKQDAAFHFNRSMMLAGPKDKEVHYGLAVGMLDLSPRKYRDTAQRLLQQAIDLPIEDAYSEFIHQAAVERFAELTETGK